MKNSWRQTPPRLFRTEAYETAVPHGLVVYCDGACEPNPGAGGWGFVVYQDGVEIYAESGGDPEATNNTMELTGALMALEWIERHVTLRNVTVTGISLFCDSQYVVKGSNEWRIGWKAKGWKRGGPNAKPENSLLANVELWQQIDAVLTRVPVLLKWCKGHAGIIGNERADELSMLGREAALPTSSSSAIYEQLRPFGLGGSA